jgi:hypothetical protein
VLLTSLQRLCIRSPGRSQPLPTGFAASLVQLKHLTKLDFEAYQFAPASLQELPAHLSILRVEVRNSAVAAASLQHMSVLRELRLFAKGQAPLRACVPTCITGLSAIGALEMQPAVLPSLSRHLMALKDLGGMLALQGLPQLQALQVSCRLLARPGDLVAAQAEAVAAAVAAATQLSSLQLHRASTIVGCMVAPSASDSCIILYPSLVRLPHLSSLVITGFALDPLDMIKLTVLSKLATLSVVECPAFGDTAAAVLACNLTGLTALQLRGCGLQSPVLLPALAGCTSLQELDLRGNALPVCDQTLLLLTALRQLTQLVLPAAASTVSADGKQQFKAAMLQLTSLQVL